MSATGISNGTKFHRAILFISVVAISGCDENGEFAFPSAGSDSTTSASSAATRPAIATTSEQDVERPDIFEVSDQGLWDGRPSLGGAWVAHPDVTDPERALIRNTATGATMTGALFRRERENPGPLLQISSDVADELGILPGAPTALYVVALRREEVVIEGAEDNAAENPVVAALDAPVNVEATPLEPVEAAATAAPASEAPAIEVNLPPVPDVVPDVSDAAGAVAASAAAVLSEAPRAPVTDNPADLSGTYFQIGIFSIEANAKRSAEQLRAADIPTSVLPQEAGGRTVWSVVSSPKDSDTKATLEEIKSIGYVDAFAIDS